jgi:hypothetical protein
MDGCLNMIPRSNPLEKTSNGTFVARWFFSSSSLSSSSLESHHHSFPHHRHLAVFGQISFRNLWLPRWPLCPSFMLLTWEDICKRLYSRWKECTASNNAPQRTITPAFDLITFVASMEIEGVLNVCFLLVIHMHIFSRTRLSVNRRLLIALVRSFSHLLFSQLKLFDVFIQYCRK